MGGGGYIYKLYFPRLFPRYFTTTVWGVTPHYSSAVVQVTPISRQLGHLRGTHARQLRKSTSHRTTIGDLRVVGSTSKWKDGTPFPSSQDPLKKTGEVCFYLEGFGESTYFFGGGQNYHPRSLIFYSTWKESLKLT